MAAPHSLKSEHVWLAVQTAPLDVDAAFTFLQDDHAGGVDLFIGTTRRWTEGRETTALAYEAFTPMVLKEMAHLVEKTRGQWPVRKVCLWHRLGNVPAPEASILIGVATPHRAAAFAACRYLIDAAKKQLPIWKKEIFADGQTLWVQGQTPEVHSTLTPEF